MASTYRIVNVSLLGAFALCLSAVLVVYANGVGLCWSRAFFGKDCIFCGCTRDAADIFSGGSPTRNAWSVYLLCGGVLEMAWRVVASFVPFGRRVICTDVFCHSVMALSLVVINVINVI